MTQIHGRAWLDDEEYKYATEYLELTALKQAIVWLVTEKKLPASSRIQLPLKKPQGTTTYCYQPAEVEAMVQHCFANKNLRWLGEVVLALATTGLRISELADLRWTDLDLAAGWLKLVDTRCQARKAQRAQARSTKNHRDRALPLPTALKEILGGMEHHHDGRVFHGPLAGRLKPDTVRNILNREVLLPLAPRFPSSSPGPGFADGRLHSFRHFFCSQAANNGVSEQALMTWLGHQDSRMVRHYYHLNQGEAHRQMAKIPFPALSQEAAP